MVQQQGANALLLDLDSTNGTFVNDELVFADEPVCLRDGDVITIGHVSLRYSLHPADESSA
jgi:pSer/pThr/pTyr-binding forkhead associated (FHA) protein